MNWFTDSLVDISDIYFYFGGEEKGGSVGAGGGEVGFY